MKDSQSAPAPGGKEWKFTASCSRSILTYSPVYSVCCEGNKHRSRPGSAISHSFAFSKGGKRRVQDNYRDWQDVEDLIRGRDARTRDGKYCRLNWEINKLQDWVCTALINSGIIGPMGRGGGVLTNKAVGSGAHDGEGGWRAGEKLWRKWKILCFKVADNRFFRRHI
ncbi:hypothetical protein Zmor_008450 [Zophobas morio]|uniref:Uncharacterized protein n=1 Tax=Zophobas morio TaxID=2755281 RepID=A0AA38MQS9_9CUCU|nr:hypothetical protein Zmor_008450 [Zophobas morio]